MAYNSLLHESILLTIKKLLGPAEDYDYFNEDIAIHINSAFARLKQLGVGPSEGFRITGPEDQWEDFMGSEYNDSIKIYIYLKTKLAFDTPSSSFVLSSIEDQIRELEWLLNVDSETT